MPSTSGAKVTSRSSMDDTPSTSRAKVGLLNDDGDDESEDDINMMDDHDDDDVEESYNEDQWDKTKMAFHDCFKLRKTTGLFKRSHLLVLCHLAGEYLLTNESCSNSAIVEALKGYEGPLVNHIVSSLEEDCTKQKAMDMVKNLRKGIRKHHVSYARMAFLGKMLLEGTPYGRLQFLVKDKFPVGKKN